MLVHLVVKLLLLRGLKRVAASTENDLDDRLVHFLERFYLLVLLFGALAFYRFPVQLVPEVKKPIISKRFAASS